MKEPVVSAEKGKWTGPRFVGWGWGDSSAHRNCVAFACRAAIVKLRGLSMSLNRKASERGVRLHASLLREQSGLQRVAPDVVSTFALSRTSGRTPTKGMASLGSLDKPAFPRSRGPVSPTDKKDVLARMSARDISNCALQSSNWLVLCT